MILSASYLRLFGVCSVVLISFSQHALACGIDWNPPKSHFDGVDFQGHVHLIKKMGEISAKSKKLPLYVIFNSNYGNSPYGGAGFEIPLIEARMLQVDENTFLLKNPAGWLWPFVRSKDKNILDGSAGWKAVINGDSITAWAPCGGKMVFSKGKITRLETKDVTLDYVYSGELLSEIREGSTTLLKVNVSSQTGQVQGLSVGLKETISFQQSSKPRVQAIADKNNISALDTSISKITLLDDKELIYEFGVNDKLQPTVNVNGSRLIVWNPSNKSILSDKEWTYNISQKEGLLSYANIKRSNPKGQQEAWECDPNRGEESFSHADGFSRKRLWFTSGKLAGRPRTITDTINGKEVRSRKWNYDEDGKLLRKIDSADNNFDLQRKLYALVKGN